MSLLRNAVDQALERYFAALDGEAPANVYQLVLSEVEIPLLNTVMKQAQGNQSKAAIWLGISRGTLRKLLEKHNIS